jgi:hypothetical protein
VPKEQEGVWSLSASSMSESELSGYCDQDENNQEFKNLLNPILFVRNVPSDSFYLILQGTVAVCSGQEGFMVKLGPFNYLGLGALQSVFSQPRREKRQPYIPDYSAKIINKARVLRVKVEDYMRVWMRELRNREIKSHQKPRTAPMAKNLMQN